MSNEEKQKTKVFVYGTLMFDDVVHDLIGDVEYTPNVILRGWKKIGLNIVKSKVDIVEGRVLHLTDEQLERIDRYEGVGRLYERVYVMPDEQDTMIAYKLMESFNGTTEGS